MSVIAKLNTRIIESNSLLCVGLDPQISTIPNHFHREKYPLFAFNRYIIDQTHPYAIAYKPNTAFYEAHGAHGWEQLALTMEYLVHSYPNIVTICDAKRADIGNTNEAYATAIFDQLQFDAITLHPYLGKKALAPFLNRHDKANIILCRTSNPDSGEFQSLIVQSIPLWQHIAHSVSTTWNENQNCMLVMGATYPEELRQARTIVGEMPLLVPGIGTQGGSIEQVITNGLDKEKRGLIINVGRAILYSASPSHVAQDIHNQINYHRNL